MMPAGQDSMWIVFDVLSIRKYRKNVLPFKNVEQSQFYWKSDIIPESLALASVCN